MKKIILDLGGLLAAAAPTRRDIHSYIAAQMHFPDYYGHNLDALYDCLTDIAEPTAVGIAIPAPPKDDAGETDRGSRAKAAENGSAGTFDSMGYLLKVRKTFADAEKSNPNLAVFDLPPVPRAQEEPPRSTLC